MRKKFTLALLSLLLVPLAMMAQDVTISPSTGNFMAAYTQEGEVGSEKGWSSTWTHDQLAAHPDFSVAAHADPHDRIN